MLNKKTKSLLFIFLILFCIAAVNAESIDNTADTSSVEIMNVGSEADIVTIDDDGNDFTALNKTINGAEETAAVEDVNGEITLQKDYTYNDSTDSAFKNGINISSAKIINGNGHTVDANNMARIFNVLSTGSLTLKNIKLINANTTGNGGAIFNEGTSAVTVINATFINNNAQSGGAIYSSKGVNATDSTFEKNTASSSGGAIYSTNTGLVNVTNSTFKLNTAKIGGAINTNTYGVNIISSTFTDNTATNGVGGAVNSNRQVSVINSTFINNTASGNDGSSGGAIYSYMSGVSATNSKFINNTAVANGGAICDNAQANGGKGADMNIINSTFIGNNARAGGAIYISSTSGNVNITNSTFTKNNASNSGGAISASKNINVTNSVFDDNTAANGGAISGTKNITVDKSKFLNNTANNGGAIYASSNTAELTVVNSNFDDNSAASGDDIYTASKTTVKGNNYTEDSYANIYVRNIIINGTVVNVLGNNPNNTYYVTTKDGKFLLNASAFVDGASVAGYNLVITDGENNYTATYVGKGMYEVSKSIFADFHIKSYTAIINKKVDDPNYTVNNGTVINNKKNTTIEVTLDDVVAGKNITGDVTIRDADGNVANITGNVTVKVNGKEYNVSVTDGKGKLNIENEFTAGNYTMDVIFEGNSEYNPSSNSTEFTIENNGINLDAEDLTKYYGNDSKFVIILTDSNGNPLANKTVTITINGKTYTRTTDADGRILMNINLIPGVYEAEVSYENITENAKITILTTIEGNDLVKYYRNGTQYYATFYNIDGTPLANTEVTFNINGVFYTRTTDENGIAKLNINLNPGEYILTAINPVNKQTYSNKVTVLTTIVGYDVVKYFKNGTQYYAIFTDLDGNPLANKSVTFNVHGVFYTRTTDEKGIAQLNINLNPGDYIITAINPVNNETYSNTIKVLNVVETKNLEMSASDRKPFEVTILGAHGAPLANAEVTFNIHGVFYHKTTDANGKVNLDINLVAGKYIITIYYNDYSVSNTILVK